MPEYDNTNQIAVWKKNENSHPQGPDFRVTANFEGRDLSISLWKKTDADHPQAPALKGKIEVVGEQQPVAVGGGSNEIDF